MLNYTGDEVHDLALGSAGSIFIVVLAMGVVIFWARTKWGRFTTFFLGALLMVGSVYMPDQSITFFETVIGEFYSP